MHAARLERAQEVGDRRLEAGGGEMRRMQLDEQRAKVAHGAAKLVDRAPEHRCIVAGAARPRPVCERREPVGEPGDLLHRAVVEVRTPTRWRSCAEAEIAFPSSASRSSLPRWRRRVSDQTSGTWISEISAMAPRIVGASARSSRRELAVTEPKRW